MNSRIVSIPPFAFWCVAVLAGLLVPLPGLLCGQEAAAPKTRPAAPVAPWALSPEERERLNTRTAEDHADMMRQLGIRELRPGKNGNPAPGQRNQANYDPLLANPYPDWPDILMMRDGTQVTTPDLWWSQRRPEIAGDFEREVYGQIPADVPAVRWEVAETVKTEVGGRPVVARRVFGHVDNAAAPEIPVVIQMAVVLPAQADVSAPVPVLIMFGWGTMPGDPVPRFPGFPEPPGPSSEEQLIAAGWATCRSAPPASRPTMVQG